MYIYPVRLTPQLIEPRTAEPDYTESVSNIPGCTSTWIRCPPHQTQSYTAQLHQISFQYSTMHTYPGWMYPPNQSNTYRARLHQIIFQYSTMHIYPEQMYPDVSHLPIGKLTYSNSRHTYKSIYQTLLTQHTTPLEYIASINNSQVTQITYTSQCKDLELL